MALVTLAEAKAQCMVDTSDGDVRMQLLVDAVSDAVLSWLKDEWRAYVPLEDTNGDVLTYSDGVPILETDTAGDFIVKPRVKLATLVEIAVQYRYTDGKDAPAVPSHWGHGYVLSAGATSLLAATRKSTVQ